MSIHLPLTQEQLGLPSIDLIEGSERAFGNAFLRAAQILHQHLEKIELSIGLIKEFTKNPFNFAVLSLLNKMNRHYYSYVLLEIHRDQIGSQFLIEHLCEAAITLTYLLEEVDNSLFSEYIYSSTYQARYLLIDVEEQLQKFPEHSDLLSLKDRLESSIAKQERAAERPFTASEACLWGSQEVDTTAKCGAIIGLDFLTNPARKIALRVIPASWLELQLSYLNSSTNSRTNAQPDINFTNLRNAAHLCLHAGQTFLEEVVNHQNLRPDIERQQQSLNVLYEWFYNAHSVISVPGVLGR